MLKGLLVAAALLSSPISALAAEQLNEYGETAEQAQRLEDLARHIRKDYLPIILICPAGMDYHSCVPVPGYFRAKAVGERVSNPFMCGLSAQELIGKTEMYGKLAPGEFIKVLCPHEKGTVDETGEGDM